MANIYFCIKSFSSHVGLLLFFLKVIFSIRLDTHTSSSSFFFLFLKKDKKKKKGNVSKWMLENHFQRIIINYI